MSQTDCNWQFISVDEFSFVAPANKATRRVILKASVIKTTLNPVEQNTILSVDPLFISRKL